MAHLVPISLRLVHPDWAERVPAPAHDSLGPAERRSYISANPHSYLSVTRSPEDLPPGKEWDVTEALAASQASLAELLASGAFSPPQPPGLYLYRLTTGTHSQIGIVGGVAVNDYDEGTVRIHEQIQPARAERLAAHLDGLQVQSSPITLAHRPTPVLSALLTELETDQRAAGAPLVDIGGADGLHQEVWSVEDADAVAQIRAELADQVLYLIDGHHRAAAASMHRAGSGSGYRDAMLCAIFATTELRNEAFHRCLHGLDLQRLDDQLAATFDVRQVAGIDEVVTRGDHEMALLLEGRWQLVRLPAGDAPGPLDHIDPVRLQRYVLGPLLGIDSSSSTDVITFRPGLADRDDLERLEVANEAAAWVMRPVSMDALMATADAGAVMPPKSTYFLPKVRSGVFLRSLRES